MHEMSIAQSIVELAQEHLHHEDCSKVNAITLQIGKLSGVVKESLEFVFPEACLNTELEDCQLNIEVIPIKIKCKICHKQQECEEINLLCNNCQSMQVEVISGNELIIKSMEIQ